MTILRRVSFSRDMAPIVEFTDGGKIWQVNPLAQDLSLSFDMKQRFCTGSHNMETGEDTPCPQNATVDSKYDQCMACMRETGFNPAFYHATTISEQQLARNAQPHIVYLAYFSPDVIKVGISYVGRGMARLLEQGARAAVVLSECKTATIARGYEAKITGMYGIKDNVQLAKKAELAKLLFDDEAALRTLADLAGRLSDDLKVSFSRDVQLLDSHYFKGGKALDLSRSIDVTAQHAITGASVAMLGSLLYSRYDDQIISLPLKKFTGYIVHHDVPALDLGVQQMSLF